MNEPAASRSTVLIATDSFKDNLSAAEVAHHLASGIRTSGIDLEVVERPVADGGEGTLEALGIDGDESHEISVRGPLDEPTMARWAVVRGAAFVEIAQAAGAELLQDADPEAVMRAGTYGVGQLILNALDHGHTNIVLTMGGSCTSDGGAGMLHALGARILDAAGDPVPPGGAGLALIDTIDLDHLDSRLADIEVTVACDVQSPLFGPDGSARMFGPQKGAASRQVELLDQGLEHWAEVLGRSGVGKHRVQSLAACPGAGASGGLAFGALILPRASAAPGADLILDLIGFDQLLDSAAVVVVGEGRLDRQTLLGKVAAVVVRRARHLGIPVIAVAGEVVLDARELAELGIERAWSVCDLAGSLADSKAHAGVYLERIGALVSQWWLEQDQVREPNTVE